MCEVDYDYDPASVWVETSVAKARKDHKCNCCRGRICAGDGYVKHFSTYEGRVTSEKVCGSCREAREDFVDTHGMIGVPRRFAHDLRECFGQESRPFWNESDHKWRSYLAGMIRRQRSAARVGRGS
jgi:hypothetical protein